MWNLTCTCQITIMYRFATFQNAEYIAKLALYYLEKCLQEYETSVNISVNICVNIFSTQFPKESYNTQFKLPLFHFLYNLTVSNQTHSLFQYVSKVQLHKKCIFLFLDIYSDTGTPTI